MSASNQLKDFSFPFPPYEIQNEFMIALCEALEGKKLGIFESPTGTGKSLSLICGALTWLEHHSAVHKEVLKSLVEESIKDDDDEDWFNSATKRIEKENEKRKAKKELDKIEREEKRMNNLRSRKAHVKQKLLESKNMDDEFRESFKDSRKEKDNSHELTRESELSLLENEFLLDDYTSEGEEDMNESDPEEEDGGCLKIFYCSRTHSQLSQFVREIQKTRFRHDARVTSLASRQNFCVNEEVSRLPSLAMINERCIDLQTGQKGISTKTDGNQTAKKKKTSSGCPFNKQMKIQNLSDQVLLEVQDLEQLISLGRKSKACPYYASRKCVKDSQLVILPYNCLLHKSTREACNIKLKDNVVIVDEAHNLLETIGNIHSVTISFQQVCCATCQLSEYVRRYEKRLSPRNLLYIRQISFLIKAYTKILSSDSTLGGNTTSNGNKISVRLLTLQDFLFETLTDNLNLFKLIQYIEKSKLAHKLHGYKKLFEGEIKIKSKESQLKDTASTSSFLAKMASAKTPENKTRERNKDETESNSSKTEFLQTKNDDEMNFGSPFFGVTEFLKAITCGNSDGRIVVSVSKDRKKPFIKYLLLNPASQFHDIVRECRSVIVAGGTMAPMDEFKNQLFLSAGASLDRLVEFSCSHVVSEENVLPLVMARGPGNVLMDFTFKNRNETRLLDELGRTLMNICNIVPGGIVCFFPSYEYEDTVYEYFHRTKIIEKISNKKRVFREPKKSSQLEKVLSGYCDAIQMGDRNRGKGAVLFSVVGGKMSEGINFSDDLGRCIVMVGLPYPNATSPELREKMDYLTKHFPCTSDGKTAGTWYYENLCFKAVNQSIGRSIRHRNDFASILLLDHRYCLKSSQARLPSWISSRIKICNQFGQAFSFIRKFFADRKK